MILLFVYLFIALFVSFICSIMEAVLLSVPNAYLKSIAEAGDNSAKAMLELKADIDRPLSAILSLNTVAHTVGAAGVGAQATIVFGEAYFGLVSAILTILILVVTEIIPKTLGANYARPLVGVVVKLLKICLFITYPLVVASSYITRLLSKDKSMATTSREELSAMANMATQEGVFSSEENKIMQNLVKLKHKTVSQVMTPRTVVVAADQAMTLTDFFAEKSTYHFSRIPVYEGSKDHVTGYVLRAEIFEKLASSESDLCLKDIKRDIGVLPDNTVLFDAWEQLSKNRAHIASVIDEYGGLDGIVTLEDIIETLIGLEILDEKDRVADMQQYAKKQWQDKKK